MLSLTSICVKTVRWSSWPLLLMIGAFLFTGYMISGRIGLMDEKRALALHKLMHLPLIVLLVVHTVPAAYLAMRRWGWINKSDSMISAADKTVTAGKSERVLK